MKITYYGHSSFGLQIGGKNLVFDPFISLNDLAKDIDVEQIPCDYLLLSHGHGDHVADAVSILKRTGAVAVANFEICAWLEKQGCDATHPMNHGGTWTFDFGKVQYVNAIHSSSMPDGSYGGNPGGFLIQAEGKTIYYSGDTALTYDMKMFGELYDIDLAFLCLGGNFTMGPQEAVIAAQWIDCMQIVGMHFDTFGYIKIDHDATQAAFEAAGIALTLPQIGETFTFEGRKFG